MNLERDIHQILEDQQCKIQEAAMIVGFEDTGDSFNHKYWHSSVISSDGFPLSGGFSSDRYAARKIAIAEFLEFNEVRNLAREDSAGNWALDLFPTNCGFAVGFDEFNTRLRSIREAAERWVMSKWIDEHYYIPDINAGELFPNLSGPAKFFVSQFDEVLFFKIAVTVLLDGHFYQIEVAQTMGLKGKGIYPGSSAQGSEIGNENGIWEHALLESFRHLQGVKNNPVCNREGIFPDNRINFFAKNGRIALQQIAKANRQDWPLPRIKLHKWVSLYNGEVYLARTIIDGWNSWHTGPLDRFLY